MIILSVDHISLLVADIKASLVFYQDILGLQSLSRPDLGFEGAWLSLGNGQLLHLLCLPNPDPTQGRPDHVGRDRHLALYVADITQAKQELSDHKIPFTLSRSGRASIFFRDPDGNGIELMQAR